MRCHKLTNAHSGRMRLETAKATTPPAAIVARRHSTLSNAIRHVAAVKSDSEAITSVTRQTT